jgi:hypothetical protein
VDEFCAQLRRHVDRPNRFPPHASAGPIAAFEHDGTYRSFCEFERRCEACGARADDDDIRIH